MLVCREIKFDRELFNKIARRSKTASFFQTGDWLSVWLRHFEKNSLFWGVFDKDDLIGIAPFYLKNDVVSLLGTREVAQGEVLTDFGDIIAVYKREEEIWKALIGAFQSKIQNIKLELNFIREDSASFSILRNLGLNSKQVDRAPYVDLPSSWDEYLISLERHNRHEIKRKMKKAKEVEFNLVENKIKNEFIERMLELIALSNPEKKEFLKPEVADFFRDLIKTLADYGVLRMFFLKYRSKLIAGLIFFYYQNEYLLYNSGFDPQYASLSPGFVLKSEFLKKAITDRVKRLNFLRGGERIKYDLGGKDNKLYKFSISFLYENE